MCEPATIAYTAGGILGGLALSKALTPKIPDTTPTAAQTAATTPPKPTNVTPPPVSVNANTPKQASKAPNVQALRTANAGQSSGLNASSASTLLTGPSGVDLSQISLGRNTLLGS